MVSPKHHPSWPLTSFEFYRPDHKPTCNVAPDDNVTIRTGRRLCDHHYFYVHLLLYAIRAMGPPKFPADKHDFILMVVVDMIPIVPARPFGRKRTIVKNILAVPACIVPEEVLDVQQNALRRVSDIGHPVYSVWIVTAGIYPEGQECRFRLKVLIAEDIIESSAHLPHFTLDLHSQSYGLFRRVNCDMDFLFESINNELRLDVENYYQLQA
ncbi:hypothetical protein DFH09DRAFT_485530 [Mycena vulgaris]|nr:hypothetical protein DFH09DRAFT_485530 [Mycena vulgaris]